MLEKCEGIVIRVNDYGETNKIVTIYTREWGKVGVMARGAKKPNSRLAAITQPFTYGNYLVQTSRGLGGLQQGEIISSMKAIKEDIFLTAYASYIAELTDRSTEDRKANPYLFELFYQALNYINEGLDPEVIMLICEMKMVNTLGLYPVLDKCSVCGSTEGRYSFSIREGGLLCHRCVEKDPYRFDVSQAAIKLLRVFYYIDLKRLGNISIKEETKSDLRKVMDSYYEEYSGLNLKSKRFLKQMDKLKDFS